ncbi:MAG: SDR family oxidoreductase [Planctomycetota bacterium]
MSTQWAVITGASAGIGADFARLFAADGCPLVLVARRRERLEELAATLPVETRICAADLATAEGVAALIAFLDEQGIEPHHLVNNAGFGLRGAFAELDPTAMHDMIRLNVLALTDLTRRYLPAMLARGSGGVLNVASLAGFQPGPNMAVYYATKAFVLHMTEAIAQEIKGRGVTMNAFCPGPVATEFNDVAGLGKPAAFGFWTMSSPRAAQIGYRAYRKGKVLCVPGVVPPIARFLNWITPRPWSRALLARLQ